MKQEVVGVDTGSELLLLTGFRARLEDSDERWFLDRLADEGYRVHAVQFPTNGADFEAEYLTPVQQYHDEVEPDAILGVSLGGLVAAHLDTGLSTVYLSPWWGIYGEKYLSWQIAVFGRLQTRARVVKSNLGRDEVGPHVTDEKYDRLSRRLSPVFVMEVYRAQEQRPPVDDDAVVFATLRDTVVALDAVGEAVSREQIRLYDGTHVPYASAGREAIADEIIETLPG